MRLNNQEIMLTKLLTPAIEAAGLILYHIEVAGSKDRTVVRIYLDKLGGINLGHCSKVSRTINTLLDVEDVIRGRYYLEVSSPGIDRPLAKATHFANAIGEMVKIKTRMAMDKNRRNFVGLIKDFTNDPDRVVLEFENKEITILLDDILKANIDFQFEETGKKHKR